MIDYRNEVKRQEINKEKSNKPYDSRVIDRDRNLKDYGHLPANNGLPKFLDTLRPSQDFIDNPEKIIALATPFQIFFLNRIVSLIKKHPVIFFSKTNEAAWVGYHRVSVHRACDLFKSLSLMESEQRGYNTPCDYQFAYCFKDAEFLEKLLNAIRNALPKLHDAYVTLYRSYECIKKNIGIGLEHFSYEKSKKELEPDKKEIAQAILAFKMHLSSLSY